MQLSKREKIAAAVAGVMVLSGVGVAVAGTGDDRPDVSVCVQALDEADAGFTALAGQIRTVRDALVEAFDGNLNTANVTLDRAREQGRSPDRYKRLEAECREAVT